MSRASAIYEGRLSHARFAPRPHEFSYGLAMLYLDLEELPSLLAAPGPLREGRFGVLSFRREDYLGQGARSLSDEVRDRVESELGFRPSGPVRLLTQVRSLGYVFNPVSFYYCFFADGRTLQAIVAEITNTPWKERHTYVLRADAAGARGSFPKRFHVSPFFDMDQIYEWSFEPPGDFLDVKMSNHERGAEVFSARLALARREWTASGLWRVALTHRLSSWKVHAAIYWQAFLLWRKGEPFFTHPKKKASSVEGRS